MLKRQIKISCVGSNYCSASKGGLISVASSNETNNTYIRAAEQNCKACGFSKYGANWYRFHGQGLLQVVTFHGLCARTTDANYSNKQTVAFAVYSMFDRIPWINIPVQKARRDLIPNITAGMFANQTDDAPFLGPGSEVAYMNELVLPFLDEMNTHIQLADFLATVDRWRYGRIRINDRNKIIPYLLSGKYPEVIDVINAIEAQNQQAFLRNCKTVKGYEPVPQKQKIAEKLEPLVSLRNDILAQNTQGIVDLLLLDYQANIRRLNEMAVPVPVQHICGNDLLRTIFF